jgi:hypothetical protein
LGSSAANPLMMTTRYKIYTVPFLQGLQETGYVVGKNAAIEYRGAEDHDDRLPALAADLVRRRVAVIVTVGAPERWRRRQRPRPYPSYLALEVIQSHRVLSPASAGPARTSPAVPIYRTS